VMRFVGIGLLGMTIALCGSAEAVDIDTMMAQSSCLIDANQIVKLSSSTQGTLSKILVKRGDHVLAGQVVAELESEVEQAMYEAADLRAKSDAVIRARGAEKVNAERKLERQRQLMAKNVISPQILEDAETAAQVAKFAVEQAILDQLLAASEAKRLHATIERRTVRSPVNGVVIKVDLHEGEFADPPVTLATIAEIRPLLVEVYLPVELYPHVKIGMNLDIHPQEPISGAHIVPIFTKDPEIDSASGTFRITLQLLNVDEAIPAGIRCTARTIKVSRP
jgi:RND family efflux transporter MFP subunit